MGFWLVYIFLNFGVIFVYKGRIFLLVFIDMEWVYFEGSLNS